MKKRTVRRLSLTLLLIVTVFIAAVFPALTFAADAPAPGKYVTSAVLNFRSVPTTQNNTRLCLVPAGTELTVSEVVYGDGYYWGKTVYNSLSGYVTLEYCKKVAEETPSGDAGVGFYKTKLNLNMRRSPTTSSNRVCIVPAGKILNVTGISKDADGNSWGYAMYSSNSGTFTAYVRLDNCEKYTMPALPAPDGDENKITTVVDVSQWQTEDDLDWVKMKENGVDGVIIRIGGRGYGTGASVYDDNAFYVHYINARAAGLHIGCYFFSYGLTTEKAQEEARATLSTINKYNCEFDMPVFTDVEDADGRHDHYYAGKKTTTAVADAYCDVIENAGLYAGIYCNLDFASNLIDESAFEGRGAWIAQYNNACTFKGRYDMWQKTKSGIITGYNGKLDVSICYVNYPLIIRRALGIPETTTVPATEPEPTTAPVETTTQPNETTTQPNETTTVHVEETTTQAPVVYTDGWAVTTAPKCTVDGVMSYYTDGVIISQTAMRKGHENTVECVVTDTKNPPKAGDIIDSAVFSSNYITSDSPYFNAKLNEIKSQGGCYCVYCLDCGEVIRIKNFYASKNCSHSYVEEITVTPTCTKEGKAVSKCIRCGITSEEKIIERAEHTGGATTLTWKTDKPYTAQNCSVCGRQLEKNFIDVGDINYDGTISVADARDVLRVAIGLDLNQIHFVKLADTDGDGALTVNDARNVLRKAIGLD